jgi:hypothetical protein
MRIDLDINKLLLYSHAMSTAYQQFNNNSMPYRRLPNTDTSRIRALRIALEKGKEMPPHKLAFSSKNILKLEIFFPQFENNIRLYRDVLSSQNKKNREYYETVKKSRIYLTHFIRVMNMAIYRGELIAETRAFYGLATDETAAPLLTSESDMVNWGRRIIEGEEFRIKKGGSPITNPTIAVVKVRYGNFLEALNHHNTLSQKTLDYCEKINTLRKEADEIILRIWNEVEKTYLSYPEDLKKEMCEEYGLVYFYRKNEVIKTFISEAMEQPSGKITSHQDVADQDLADDTQLTSS